MTDKAAHARLNKHEAELFGDPGSPGLKGQVTVLTSDVARVETKVDDLDSRFEQKMDAIELQLRQIRVQLETPQWVWPAIVTLAAIASGCLTVVSLRYAGFVGP